MSDKIAVSAIEPTLWDELAALQDDVFDMANVPSEQTGIEGTIFISTEMGAHGPRVKYYLKPGRRQPSFSVSISEKPEVLASSLPDRVVSRVAPAVIEWVRVNRQALLRFWREGDQWMTPDVAAFLSGLQRIDRT